MKTMFKSQEIWDMVEHGYEESSETPTVPSQQLRENHKRDAKALFFIQSALDDEIFPRIAAASSSKQAWEILRTEFYGDKQVIDVKLQTLHSDFTTLTMKENEPIQGFLSRVSGIVSHMKTYVEIITDETIVSKVLRSLNSDYKYIVTTILESKDLSTYTFDELMSSLLSHGERFKPSATNDEKALQVKEESSFKGKNEYSGDR